MRLFIALPLPGSVKEQLIELKQPIEGVRWESKSKLHLTLKFLGDTDPDQLEELANALDSIKYSPFSIDVKGFGYFPTGKQPKVLWAGVVKNEDLVRLQQAIEDKCTSLGFEAETRPFKPHITIARANGVSKRDVMSFINQHKQFGLVDVPVKEFVLYESKLGSEGARHKRRCTFKLRK